MSSKNDPLRYDDIQFSKMILGDFDRAQVWANYLDRFTTYETEKPSRVLGLLIRFFSSSLQFDLMPGLLCLWLWLELQLCA